MYPPVTQFETRRRQVEERLAAREARRRTSGTQGWGTWLSRLTPSRRRSADPTSEMPAGPLAQLPRRERRELNRLSSRLEYAAGKLVISEGKLADSFFLIESGEVAVIGRAGAIAKLGADDFFGEIALLKQRPRTTSIVASTDVRLRVLTQNEFAHAMRFFPAFARVVRSVASRRLSLAPA